MITVGLTGGIATGKSTVAQLLTLLFGVPVVDADQVSRQVVEPGQPALQALAHAFPQALSEDGTLHRRALREIISHDASARSQVEAILHPAIYAETRRQLDVLEAAGHAHAVVEAALLVETGGYRRYDLLMVASCAPEEQIRRVMERDGVSEADARAIQAAQLPMEAKEAVAHVVIRTDGPREALEDKVRAAWESVSSR